MRLLNGHPLEAVLSKSLATHIRLPAEYILYAQFEDAGDTKSCFK